MLLQSSSRSLGMDTLMARGLPGHAMDVFEAPAASPSHSTSRHALPTAVMVSPSRFNDKRSSKQLKSTENEKSLSASDGAEITYMVAPTVHAWSHEPSGA